MSFSSLFFKCFKVIPPNLIYPNLWGLLFNISYIPNQPGRSIQGISTPYFLSPLGLCTFCSSFIECHLCMIQDSILDVKGKFPQIPQTGIKVPVLSTSVFSTKIKLNTPNYICLIPDEWCCYLLGSSPQWITIRVESRLSVDILQNKWTGEEIEGN